MSNEVDRTGMRPKIGQTSIILPITFDYSGGRREHKKSARLWSIIIGVIGLVIGLGIMFNKKGFFVTNLIFGLATLYGTLFIIRFFLLKEGKIRQRMIELADSDYKRQVKDFWGIYSIDDLYPYFCRFRNGRSGLFVILNKDVILGKYSESEFEHYEAIGDAYNLCGSSNIQMCHIDYMDNIGTDDRLEQSFANLERVENPDMKDLLNDIFSYQQAQMLERVTTFDAYLFSWKGSDINAWSTIQRILSCFMQANFRSYRILNESDLRELAKTLFNLNDFSVVDAMSHAFNTESLANISPIKIIHADGSEEILGKTSEEKKQEAELKQKQQELKKEELKRRKNKKNKKKTNDVLNEDEEINLF